MIDHSETTDMLEEDSVDRLWLVIRSLKTQEGKYVNNFQKLDLGLQNQEV